ncbi:hypothetical protein [Streptomyces sp. CMB-StM0423]|uniref:hypothetical protein n=1 Tax=Streptomyces sp. CMB-StM0423 TaxID=2059884 RepID=UPI001F3CD61E|nr:hypothetical protein [Streptomyces sp. CMB-StM0423]
MSGYDPAPRHPDPTPLPSHAAPPQHPRQYQQPQQAQPQQQYGQPQYQQPQYAQPAPEPAAPAPAYAQQPPSPYQGQGQGQPHLQPPAPPKPPRRWLRPALRWGAAVVLLAGAAFGSAYAVTGAERGDLPGLATESDGRWDYPELELPALPEGEPPPFAPANAGEIHHADLRDLLLPAPAGAEDDDGLKTEDGWLAPADFTSIYVKEERKELRQALTDDAVRHIAATGWTMPDGTRARVYLLQFNTGALAAHFYDEQLAGGISTARDLTGAPEVAVDERWSDKDQLPETELYVYDEAKPRGKEHVRQAYVVAGDTVGLVTVEAPGEAELVPFQQTLVLQHQLLG